MDDKPISTADPLDLFPPLAYEPQRTERTPLLSSRGVDPGPPLTLDDIARTHAAVRRNASDPLKVARRMYEGTRISPVNEPPLTDDVREALRLMSRQIARAMPRAPDDPPPPEEK